ncbi:sulfatase-like hydrolase/transferase [Halogeometricum luteum]|uniref:Sulfatase-like hydrolase/transferase n=1 Tax=Halogeometricum luteum TaxID=2950537 RepID=A0ABU2G2U0_9EURY|nr:sulfatase-like hydrolase/transferase [Halogeometricum sp. S3BR5-2]MDS0295110.1 sulfatase-like hydrolase/transferase [Halogeometricum sp. S3BR5-2]
MHVVLVTASAVRRDHVRTEDGRVDAALPALARLAGDATVFSRAYTSSPDHESTLRAILTGTHPTEDSGRGPTLVDALADAGWETGLFHGRPDEVRSSWGFEAPDESPDRTVSGRLRASAHRRIADETVLGGPLASADRLIGSSFGTRVAAPPAHSAADVTERALSWLDETSGPRFLWVHYDTARAPHVPREGTASDGIDPRTATKLGYATASAPDALTDEERATLKTLYRGELEHLDRHVGRLFDGIQSRLDVSDTVTAFTGTGGCPLGERGRWYDTSGDFYEESVRVPLFVHGPGFDAERVEFAASSVDVLPTLAAAAGVERAAQRGGSDLRSFTGRRVTERQVFAAAGAAPAAAMVCNGRWKLSRRLADGRETLFDHNDDPAERRDRSGENLPVHRALSHALDYFVENRRRSSASARSPIETKTRS